MWLKRKSNSKNTNYRHCESFSSEAISTLTDILKKCFTSVRNNEAIFRTPHKIINLPYYLLLISYFLLPIAFYFLPANLHAQRNNFQNYSLKEGLPQTTIYCITQDNRGYLWLGTDGGGLCRFDGINFKTFNKKNGFNAENVRSMMQDNKGRIWAGTQGNGIIVYDGYSFRTIGTNNGLVGSTVLSLFEDKDGTIWAGTDDSGLNKITQLTKDSFYIQVIDEQNGLSNNSVFDIHQDKEGNLWLATFGGVNVIAVTKDTFQIYQLHGGREIPSEQILSIAEDNEGALWFGTLEEGVFCIAPSQQKKYESKDFQFELLSRKVTSFNEYNGFNAKKIWNIFRTTNNELWFASTNDGIIRKRTASHSKDNSSKYIFEHYTDKEGLPGNQILSLFEDNTGNVWIGTNGDGLSKFMGDRFSHFSEKDGLTNNKVQGIHQDSSGNYWLATNGGLVKMNTKSVAPTFSTYTTKDGLPGNSLLSISIGKSFNNQHIWAGSDKGMMKFDGKKITAYTNNEGLLDNSAYSIFVDKNGIVWCGTKEGINRFDGKKFLDIKMEKMMFGNDKDVTAIIQDKTGDLWFGTGGGLARYRGEASITTYNEAEGLEHKKIKSLAEGPDGNIWIGTSNGGLYVFDIHSEDKIKIHLVANDSLLSSNSIRSLIFEDKKNMLLVGTDKGVDKINFDTKWKITSIRNYNASDGFIGVDCNDNAIYKDKSGCIWFGTVQGLTKYNPAAERTEQNLPQIHITSIKLSFKDVDWSTKADSVMPWFGLPYGLKLPYNENHISFQYSAISLDNPQKVRYRYQLEGLEEDWSPLTTQTEHDYSGLSAGTYTFKVMAINANGKWSAPTFISFTINPPWYRTIWFYTICIITILILIYSFIKVRERNLIKEKKILEDKVHQRTIEVVKQKEEIEKQKELIEEKNRDITDSINYAQRIQNSLLASDKMLKKNLCSQFFKGTEIRTAQDYFIYFQPKDIVSGDFYWASELPNNQFALVTADSTGHGVPGAIMSMLNISCLNEAINGQKLTNPKEILNYTRSKIIHHLSNDGSEEGGKDGMDCSLISFDFKNNQLTYSAANNPVWIVRTALPDPPEGTESQRTSQAEGTEGSNSSPKERLEGAYLIECSPDKMPVGKHDKDAVSFTQHLIELCKGDIVYTLTDGMPDQFGGPKNKKFMTKKLKELVVSISHLPMSEQKESIKAALNEWKAGVEQVDDILVIGVRL